jgi:hypothetical protein
MSSQRDPVPHHWRSFLRFSVRGLIAFVIVIGAVLGWVVHQAHVQRDAVASIRRTGGEVFYDWEWKNGHRIPGAEPWPPRWLVDRIGVDYFGQVTTVQLLSSASETDASLADVGRLTRLQKLDVLSASGSDAGLAHLKALSRLSRLNIANTQVTDAGLANLKGLTSLRVLDLSGTHVTDAGLAHLKVLSKLSRLDLSRTLITDAGMKELNRALPGLTIIR